MNEAEQVSRALNGRKAGAGYICFCPNHDNTRSPALSVAMGANGQLLVNCHAGCDGRAVIATLQALGHISGKGERAAPPDPSEVERRRRQDADKLAKRLAHCHELFSQARTCEGTIAETYLVKARGIGGVRYNKLKNTLRFHGNLLHSPSGKHMPAIIAQIRGANGRALGAHRTYLRPDGSGKADVTPNKMMLGPSAGGAVRFGPDGPVIALAEGIETALSVARASRLTVWATLSTSGLKGLMLPPPPVAEVVIICADNDEAGLSAAEDKAGQLEAEGRVVSIIHPPNAGDDFNDVLRGPK